MKRREFERTTPEAVGLRSEDIEWLLDELESWLAPHLGTCTSWKAALLRCTA